MNRSDSIRRDRSFDSVLNKLMRMRSQNHESFKAAMYNFLIAAGIGAFVAVCFILGPFFKPLVWAFLIGAVLFPFKRKLAQMLNSWFERLELNDANVFISLLLSPLEVTEFCGSMFVNWLRSHWQILSAFLGAATSLKLLIQYAPKGLLCNVWYLVVAVHTLFVDIIGYLNIYLLLAIVIAYMSTVYLFWTPENSLKFVFAGQSLWIAIACYGCSFLGAVQVPAFMIVMLYVGVSIIYHLHTTEDPGTFINKVHKLLDQQQFAESVSPNLHENMSKKNSIHSDVDEVSMDSIDLTTEIVTQTSDTYLKFLFYACVITFMYRNLWICILTAVPVILHLIYRLGNFTGFTDFITQKINDIYTTCKVSTKIKLCMINQHFSCFSPEMTPFHHH